MYLGNNIRYLRKAHGMSQEQLSDALGYKSYTTIQKWESGVSEPPLKVAHSIAALFHVDIDDLTKKDLSSPAAVISAAEDKELTEYLEMLKTRPECRMLFKLTKDASKADVEKAVAIVEALRRTEER